VFDYDVAFESLALPDECSRPSTCEPRPPLGREALER
jgi:hypothetical protein